MLAVDDDALVLTNTVAMLEDLGHTGLAASSGKQALDILRQEEWIDLVITDQAMPHMSGLQLIEAIRKEWPDMPVMLATGYAEMKPGAGAGLPRLAKPFTEDDLAEQIVSIRPRERERGRVLKFPTGSNGAGAA